MSGRGILLVNLGTPDGPDVASVRRYLAEFLSDPFVIDIPGPLRWMLLHLIILPRRPAQSAEAYEKVWTDRGSPLLFHGIDLVEKVRARVGGDVPVELGMRYGDPSVRDALDRLTAAGADTITVLPLFPQYSEAATRSAVERVEQEAARLRPAPKLEVVRSFYEQPDFIAAWAALARPMLDEFGPDRVLLSYHGVPERHCRKTDPTGSHCFASPNCCDAISDANRDCYRAHCYATSRALVRALDLAPGTFEVAFQSRLGRTPWIRPYFDERVIALAASGVKRLAVLSPAFVADCLETLEEIGMRAADDFRAHGGEDLLLVPSLNATDAWADAVVAICRLASAS